MCDICLKHSCPPNCPNYIHKIVGYCEACEKPIYDTDPWFADKYKTLFYDEECVLRYYSIKRWVSNGKGRKRKQKQYGRYKG